MAADALVDPWCHAPLVRRALRSLGVEPDALDDAVQDVFTVIVRREGDFDRTRSLTNWLWGVARGVASTHRRSRRRRARLAEALGGGAEPEHEDLEQALVRARAAERIAEFVASLPVSLREVFVLSELHGCTGPEIAERLAINLNTAYARIRSARLRFEAALVEPAAASWASRVVRAFAPYFAASSKSVATATLGASLVWVGGTLPIATPHDGGQAIAPVSTPAPTPPRAPSLPMAAASRGRPAAPTPTNTEVALATAPVRAVPSVARAAPVKPAAVEPSDPDADAAARRGGAGNISYYDFVEGDRLTGEVLRPDGAEVDLAGRVKFRSLITLRGHFVPELLRVAKDL